MAPISLKPKSKWNGFHRVPDGPIINPAFSDYPLADAPNSGRISPDNHRPDQQLEANEGAVGGVDAFPYTRRVNDGGEYNDDDEAFVSRLRSMGKCKRQFCFYLYVCIFVRFKREVCANGTTFFA